MDNSVLDASVVNVGNLKRVKKFLERCEAGEKLKVGFIGGSITQGSLASKPEYCYAARTVSWLRERFTNSEFEYINAGVGGTTSHYGTARAERDLLCHEPDLIFIEFSVNDENNIFYRETYEGLVRRCLYSKNKPAVILLFNVMYSDGTNAEDQHLTVGRYYRLPCISVKSSIYRLVAEGELYAASITPDMLHPNDKGHDKIAELLCYFLDKVPELDSEDKKEFAGFYSESNEKMPITKDKYEKAEMVTDPPFTGRKKGDSEEYAVDGSEIAVQYIKHVDHPACIAKAILDGDDEHAVVLDGNFDETWGDKLEITNLLVHGENKTHIIKIVVTDGNENFKPFNLLSLIVSK